MSQKATMPIIIVAAVVALGLVVFLYKQFMGPPPTNTGTHTFPSFIDPATGKPKTGATSSSGGTPPQLQGMPPGGR